MEKIYYTIRTNDGAGSVIYGSENKYDTSKKLEELARTMPSLAFCCDKINEKGEVIRVW